MAGDADAAASNPPIAAPVETQAAAPSPAAAIPALKPDAAADASPDDLSASSDKQAGETAGDVPPPTINTADIAQAAAIPAPPIAASPASPTVDPDTASVATIGAGGTSSTPLLTAQAPRVGDKPAAATPSTTPDAATPDAAATAPGQPVASPTQAAEANAPALPASPAIAKVATGEMAPDLKANETNAAAPASTSPAAAATTKPAADESARPETLLKRPSPFDIERGDAPAHARAATAENALQTPDSTPQSGPAQLHQPGAAAPALPDAARAQLQPQPATPLPMVPITIGLQALEGAREFQIRLDPDDLGRVDVKLTIGEDGRVAASLTVDRVDTLALLQRDARTLERAFDQAGFTADSDSLKFSLRQDHTGQQQSGSQRDATPTPAMRQIHIEAPADAPIPQWRAPAPVGGVDIRI